MEFRKTTPVRSTGVPTQKDYRNYREQLKSDFNGRCGYCDDKDEPRAVGFEIDHFVPQKIDSGRENDYGNLVYACRSCNNAKRAKWPTKDKTKPNDGTVGWIDPCNPDYAKQFERDVYGSIVPVTALGKWMYDALKLWKPQHELLWCFDMIESTLDEIEADLTTENNSEKLFKIIKIRQFKDIILHKLYV